MSEIKKQEEELNLEDLTPESEPEEIEEGQDDMEGQDDTPDENPEDDDEQDPLKKELERIKQQKTGRSELEKAIFKRNQIDRRIRELKGDEDDIDDDFEDNEDDRPVTLGMLKKMQAQSTVKTALSLAVEEIDNEVERELVIYHLENTIKSTGNPKQDLSLARTLVNSVKNSQIAEELARKGKAKTHVSSGGSGKHVVKIVLTPEEQLFTRPPFNMTPEQIVATRKKQ